MKKLSVILPFYFLLFTFALCLPAFAQNLTVREIMREPSLAGMRPESEKLAPDGAEVIFSWNAEGREPRDLYIVDTSGSNLRVLVNAEQNYEARNLPPASKLNYGLNVRDDFTKAREKNLGGAEFSPDSKRILFLQNSDIYVLDLDSQNAKPRRITRTQNSENGARWLDNDSILYNSGGNYFVLDLKETSLIQVTKDANPQSFVSIFNATPSKDGKLLAYVLSDGSRQKALFVPNYLGEFVQAQTTRRGFTDQKIYVAKTDGSLEKPFEINLPKAEGAGYIRGIDWAADNASLVVDRIDKDLKRRQIFYVFNVGRKDEKTILVTEEQDEKWIAPLSRIVEPNPKDNSQILFASERDGFNHLYLAILERAAPQPNPKNETRQENPTNEGFSGKVVVKQLDKGNWEVGNWEVDWAKWTANGKRIIYSSNWENSGERQFTGIEMSSGKSFQIYPNQKGMKTNPQIDETNDEPTLIYEFSTWNSPTEINAVKVKPNVRGFSFPIRLTNSTPASFKQIKWNAPQFIDIPTRDGKIRKSKIYTPADFDKSKKYPMVVFVHGAGYLQNTIHGWNNYYREFMFNELLTQKGYVVLDIDYRGSAGYGRDWRTD
ncbi:MAG: DPP IV N-terminal domain-containing protein, partial [Pyrinomonadaceae bacterium]